MGESSAWIDARNNRVRLDVNIRRGEEKTFDTVYQAARWIEKQINKYNQVQGSYIVDNICDLYADSQELQQGVKEILGDDVIKNSNGEFKADDLFGVLFCDFKTGGQEADVNLWMLASVMRYFTSKEFKERYSRAEYIEDDARMLEACYLIYSWGGADDPGIMSEFRALLKQIAKQ